jgi:hypothetical protein
MSTFPYWCSESFSVDGKVSSWAPVTQTDNLLLEQAMASGDKLIYIETKRTSANLETRTLRGCYDFPPQHSTSAPPLPARRLIRATWFYLDSSSGKEVPFSEEAARRIEDWFNVIKDGE